MIYAYASSQLTYLRFRRIASKSPPAILHDPPALNASVGKQVEKGFLVAAGLNSERSSRSVLGSPELSRGHSGHNNILLTLSARLDCVWCLCHLERRFSPWCVC